jgi:hypothetical protein
LGTMKEPISVYSLVSRFFRLFGVWFEVGRDGGRDGDVGEPARVARSELVVDALEQDLRTLI